jgi:hypothetical protein
MRTQGGELAVTAAPDAGMCFAVKLPLGELHRPKVLVAADHAITAEGLARLIAYVAECRQHLGTTWEQ